MIRGRVDDSERGGRQGDRARFEGNVRSGCGQESGGALWQRDLRWVGAEVGGYPERAAADHLA